jgi:hypothetical protein
MIGSSSRASNQMGLTRDLLNLVVERRRQGNKMSNKKERKRIRSSVLTFAKEQEEKAR